MRVAMLISKYCKLEATYFGEIIPTDVSKKPFFDNGVPFKFGFIRSEEQKVFNVPNLRTKDTTHTIQTFRDLRFKVGDRIEFDNLKYIVQEVSFSYYESANNRLIKQYFITLK